MFNIHVCTVLIYYIIKIFYSWKILLKSSCSIGETFYNNEIVDRPSRPKPVQSQQSNVRTTFTERCSNVILLTLNRFLPAGEQLFMRYVLVLKS